MKRFITWVLGRDLFTAKSRRVGGMQLRVSNPPIFEYAPTGDWFSLTLHIYVAPNVIHRAMQRAAFGIKYRMLKPDQPKVEE